MLQGRFPAYPRKQPELSDRGALAQTEKEIMLLAENGWQTIAPLKNITWHQLNPCGSIQKKISMRQHPSSGQSFPSSLHLDREGSLGVLRFEPAPTRTVSGNAVLKGTFAYIAPS